MKKLLKTAAVALASTMLFVPATISQAAPLPDGDPALWVVRDSDTTIYLFGTMHALDGKIDWFNEEVKAAFDRSAELTLETPDEDDKALEPVIMKYALDSSGRPLSGKLSPASREKLSRSLLQLGLPENGFDNFKPFFAAIMLAMISAEKLGMSGDQGAESVLVKAAKKAGKPISGLETTEFQMSLFNRLPESEQIKMLESTLDELDEIEAEFQNMMAIWAKGDADAVAAEMNDMHTESPAAYKLLISDRNATWVEWIRKRLDRPGTVFVGVGAGHLGGKDSLQDLLAKRGIRVERVPAH